MHVSSRCSTFYFPADVVENMGYQSGKNAATQSWKCVTFFVLYSFNLNPFVAGNIMTNCQFFTITSPRSILNTFTSHAHIDVVSSWHCHLYM